MTDKPNPDGSSQAKSWHVDPESATITAKVYRVVDTSLRGAFYDRIWARAGNMTYLTLLHLVPLGALALSLSSRLGWEGFLIRWIEERLSPTAPELAGKLVAAMNRLDIVAVGYIGLAAIIIAGVFAFSQLEQDLGEIWGTRGSREWWRRILLYPLTIVVGPTVLAVVLALGAMAEARATLWIDHLQDWGSLGRWLYHWLTDLPVLFQLLPYALVWVLLTLLYYLVTSAPIRFRSAVIGGLFAGVVWQLAQRAYIDFQFGSATYREIWGFLAQIPLLLIWLYASWLILFLGAEVVFAWQYRHAYLPKWPIPARLTPALEQRAVVDIACEVLRSSQSSSRGASAASISMRRRLPWPLVERVARDLVTAGLLNERRTSSGYFYSHNKQLTELTAGKLIEAYRSAVDAQQSIGEENTPKMNVTLGHLSGLKEG